MLLLGRELLPADMTGISKLSNPCCLHPCQAWRAPLTTAAVGPVSSLPSVLWSVVQSISLVLSFSGIYPPLPNMNPMYVPPPPPYSGAPPAGPSAPSAPPAWVSPGMPGKWDWAVARVWVQKGAWGLGLRVAWAQHRMEKLLLQELHIFCRELLSPALHSLWSALANFSELL